MLFGVASAVLVCLILRPLGLIAAAAGGLFYAVFYPAVYAEHTTLLEAPGNTALLVEIWLLNRARGSGPGRHVQRLLVVAGALLGLSAGLKIWGVVVIVLVVSWEAVARASVVSAGWWEAWPPVVSPCTCRSSRLRPPRCGTRWRATSCIAPSRRRRRPPGWLTSPAWGCIIRRARPPCCSSLPWLPLCWPWGWPG